MGWAVVGKFLRLGSGSSKERRRKRRGMERGREGNVGGRGREGRKEGLHSPRGLAGHIPGKICAREDLPGPPAARISKLVPSQPQGSVL